MRMTFSGIFADVQRDVDQFFLNEVNITPDRRTPSELAARSARMLPVNDHDV
jgi:hypothetical protein